MGVVWPACFNSGWVEHVTRIGILESDAFSPTARAHLEKLGEVVSYSGNGLAEFLSDMTVLFVRLGHRIDAEFLALAPKLRVLCSPTTGVTHIDLSALSRRRIALLTLKGEIEFLERIRATPEHAIGLLIALLRNYRTAFIDSENAHWDRDRCRGEELYGMDVGIIGFGRVGRRLAAYLHAFGAKVGWYDPHITDAVPVTTRHASVKHLIDANRAIILAASYQAETPPIIDKEAIDGLEGKYFVNVARGELVDEDALLALIDRRRLAGCAVDVIADEFNPRHRKRWISATREKNVIVTPHIGGATFASMQATEEFIAAKLAGLLATDLSLRTS